MTLIELLLKFREAKVSEDRAQDYANKSQVDYAEKLQSRDLAGRDVLAHPEAHPGFYRIAEYVFHIDEGGVAFFSPLKDLGE